MKEKDYIELVKNHHAGLYRLVYLCFPEKEVATEIVKEAYSKLWQNVENSDLAKAQVWLFSTAYRILIERLRKIGSHGQAPEEFIFDKYSTTDFDFKNIHPHFGSLTVKQKAIIILTDIEGFDFLTIADMLYVDFIAIKTALFRARRKLKEELESSKK